MQINKIAFLWECYLFVSVPAVFCLDVTAVETYAVVRIAPYTNDECDEQTCQS